MDFNYEALHKAFLEYHKRAEEMYPTLKGSILFFSVKGKLPPPLEMTLDQFREYCGILMKKEG